MRIAIVIIAALVIAGAIWVGVSGGVPGEDHQAVSEVPAEPEFSPRPTVCSMDPAVRPRPGQRSCSARP